jgi:hypothetical protein
MNIKLPYGQLGHIFNYHNSDNNESKKLQYLINLNL